MSQTSADKAYAAQMKAWIKSQQNSIQSCQVVMQNLKRTIAVNQKQLILESVELRLKKEMLATAKRDYNQYLKTHHGKQTRR
jgi:type II secretory pathway component PulJ